MLVRTSLFACLVPLGLVLSAACVATPDQGVEENDGQRGRPIKGGTTASAYPEAVLVDMYQNGQLQAYCSGSVIAPKVVLTAGHCVFQFTSWKITAPYASNQKVNASSGTTYDWQVTSESVDPSKHDIGLIFLDQPINLPSYPTLSTSKLAANTLVQNIGRIQNGNLSTTNLFVGAATKFNDGSAQGFPFDYYSTDIIESGDSGGPDELPGSHTIVSVNSGAGTGTQVLARVDLIGSWIQQQIAAHGGNGNSGSSSASTSSSTASTGSGTTTGSSSSTGGGTGGSTGSSCSHSLCSQGTKLTASCDSCAQTICAADSYCCNTKWDSQCVGEVASVCGESTCGGSSSSTSSTSSTGSGTTSTGSGNGSACGSVDFAGECVGSTVEWCENNNLNKLNCASSGETCGFDNANGYYNCL